jgi:hypothetical protein
MRVLLALAVVASTSWSTQAAHVCTVYRTKARTVLGTTAPKTPAASYRLAKKVLPLERAELAALERIRGKRPAGATRALAAARADIVELRAAIFAWPKGKTAFQRAFNVWAADRRTLRAFAAAGVGACAH